MWLASKESRWVRNAVFKSSIFLGMAGRGAADASLQRSFVFDGLISAEIKDLQENWMQHTSIWCWRMMRSYRPSTKPWRAAGITSSQSKSGRC
jgi:hypothetical protein